MQTSGYRETPDVSFDADPNTGVAMYDSYGQTTPWFQAGGTSLACPSWAGLIAVADQFRHAEGVSLLSSTTALTALYGLPATDFHDITSGSNGTYSATTGYDMITGIGTPIANNLIASVEASGVSSYISFTQGQAIPSSTVLATFIDPGADTSLGDFRATINWGDGTQSNGTISLASHVFTVKGGHTYSTMASPYTVVVSIVHNSMSAVTATDAASNHTPDTMVWGAATSGNWTAADWVNTTSYPTNTIDAQVNTAATVTVTGAQAACSLELSNGAVIVIAAGGTLTVTNSVTLGSGAIIEVDSGGTLILSGLIQGAGTAGSVTLKGGTLEATFAFTTAVPVTLGTGGGTVNTNGYSVTLSGSLGGSGKLTKAGAGTLTLAGSSNSYSGGTTVVAGTLLFARPSDVPSTGIVNIGRSGSADLTHLGADINTGQNTNGQSTSPSTGQTSQTLGNATAGTDDLLYDLHLNP